MAWSLVAGRFIQCEMPLFFSATNASSATTALQRTRGPQPIGWNLRSTVSSARHIPRTERPGKDVSAMAASDTSKSKSGFVARVGRFVKDVRSELRKVAWPNRKELTSYTAIVLVAVAIVAVYIGAIDSLIRLLLGFVIS